MEGQQEEEGVVGGGILQGQKEIWSLVLAFVEPMALKCALELRIPDIIHSHGSAMSLSQIVSHIGSPSLDPTCLSRVMRLLVHKNIFTAASSGDQSDETLYGLTHSSRLLLQGSEMKTLAPWLYMVTHPLLFDPWQQLSAAIKDGTTVFDKAYGSSLWELTSGNPELNKLFNISMENLTKFNTEAILALYKDSFHGVETLADVGGGTGYLVSEIVKANWPRIKGINFDSQHVVETAPAYAGVTHVGGDMFQSIPPTDAIIMKSVLHNWGDEDCLKILQNCRRALPKKTGKLILIEFVVEPGGREMVDDIVLKLDLLMMVHCGGGKERTQVEWINLSSQFKFIKTPTVFFMIEAHAS